MYYNAAVTNDEDYTATTTNKDNEESTQTIQAKPWANGMVGIPHTRRLQLCAERESCVGLVHALEALGVGGMYWLDQGRCAQIAWSYLQRITRSSLLCTRH